MMKSIRRFIKKNLITTSHPFFWSLWCRRQFAKCQRHSHMSYAEIEAKISAKYERVFGRKLNWDNPQTYNEKINVSKVYMPTPLKTRLADKYLVREWIREKIGGEYLIPLLGVYDSFDEIDFDSLPDRFVIKCNHDSTSVTLVSDKSKLNLKTLKRKYDFYLRRNYAWPDWQMHYRDIKPRLIIEHYIEGEMNEYKFYCFNGKPYFCFTTFGRRYVDLSISFYDMDWNIQPFSRPDHTPHNKVVPRPAEYDELKRIASKLCEGFDHVRVDLYIAEGHIYNGEMTFTTANGFRKISPDEWDYKLGELWQFDNTIRRKILSERTHP